MIDFTKKLLSDDKSEMKCPLIVSEDIDLFYDILASDKRIADTYNNCDLARTFYAYLPDVKKVFGQKAENVFYASKCGYIMKGAPMKIVYIIIRAIDVTGITAPNYVLANARKYISRYADKVFVSEAGKFNLYDVINNCFSYRVTLVTDSMRKVQNQDFNEVFIKSCNSVALLPRDIYDSLSFSDCDVLEYKPSIGIMINDVPIRCLCGRLGITLHDFDLRECV